MPCPKVKEMDSLCGTKIDNPGTPWGRGSRPSLLFIHITVIRNVDSKEAHKPVLKLLIPNPAFKRVAQL